MAANRQARRQGAAINRGAGIGIGIGIGSVVKLRSGGKPMTVEGMEGPLVTCAWHMTDGHPAAQKYQSSSIVLVSE